MLRKKYILWMLFITIFIILLIVIILIKNIHKFDNEQWLRYKVLNIKKWITKKKWNSSVYFWTWGFSILSK